MKKRDWVFLIALCVMVLMLPLFLIAAFIIAIITFPAYMGLIGIFVFFLSAGGYIFSVITQRAKALEKYIPWWKQSSVVYALSYGGYAATSLMLLFIHDQNNINITLFLLLPISMGLYTYAFILSWKQNDTNKDLGAREKAKGR
jgi:hypothetical protein